VRGLPLDPAPCPHGLLGLLASSIGLGSGTSVAVVAWDAPQQQREAGAPALRHVHWIGVAVAEAGTGATLAEWRKRLSAQRGRPAASLQDQGRALQQAVARLADDGLDRPCLDASSPAAAGMLQRASPPHPAFQRLWSACRRVSGKRTPTRLACWAPPPGRTQARCMHVHRFVAWAARVLPLAPPGGAKRGSMGAKRRSALDARPACKTLSTRFQGDAGVLLACPDRRHNRGRGTATVAPCAARIAPLPTAAMGQECRASLRQQLGIATT
jgi:hypothetical protein